MGDIDDNSCCEIVGDAAEVVSDCPDGVIGCSDGVIGCSDGAGDSAGVVDCTGAPSVGAGATAVVDLAAATGDMTSHRLTVQAAMPLSRHQHVLHSSSQVLPDLHDRGFTAAQK